MKTNAMKLGVPDLVTNSYFPALAAVELGFFAAQGLDVEIELIYPQTVDALRDGKVDFAADCAHVTLEAFPGWRGAKVLMALSQGMYWLLILRSDLNVARGNLQALKGLRIGAGAGVDLALRQLLSRAGVDPVLNNIKICPVPGGDAPGASFGVTAAKALEAGTIDGFWANGMAAESAIRRGVGSVVLDVRRDNQPPGARAYTFSALMTSDRLIKDNPASVESAMRAVCGALTALRNEPALAAKVGERLFPPQQAGMIEDVIRRDIEFYEPSISPADVEAMNEFSTAIGLLDGPASFDHVVATEFRTLWSR